jgi:hypothetical protein
MKTNSHPPSAGPTAPDLQTGARRFLGSGTDAAASRDGLSGAERATLVPAESHQVAQASLETGNAIPTHRYRAKGRSTGWQRPEQPETGWKLCDGAVGNVGLQSPYAFGKGDDMKRRRVMIASVAALGIAWAGTGMADEPLPREAAAVRGASTGGSRAT